MPMHGELLCVALRLSVCPLEKKSLEKNHISKTIDHRVMKFGQNMDMDDSNVDLEGQGHRSNAKVTRSKKHDFRSHLRSRVTWVKVKGHMGQGQRSTLKVKVTRSKM